MNELRTLKRLCAAGPTLEFAKLGKCRGARTKDFYPDHGNPPHPPASAICETCPVRVDCLAWALCHERHGTWGGTNTRQRARLRTLLRISCKAPEVPLEIEERLLAVVA